MMPATIRPGATVQAPVTTVERGVSSSREDFLAAEEPLEVRVTTNVGGNSVEHKISVTMRTPGNDFELAAGFLFSEGLIKQVEDIDTIAYCTDPLEPQNYNVVNVTLAPGVQAETEGLSRHIYTTSSCGICGKASIELVRTACNQKPIGEFRLAGELLVELPERMKAAQGLFSRTGGIHASALFDREGKLIILREDVGRHNALDKLVGALLTRKELPASNAVLLVSGRASFELVQKAVIAGIPFLAAVGAPSSLAASLSDEYGVTLVGFLRGNRFNVYCNKQRLTI